LGGGQLKKEMEKTKDCGVANGERHQGFEEEDVIGYTYF